MTTDKHLLSAFIKNLDRHLIFPLLEFEAEKEGGNALQITKAKYELLKQTNMADYVTGLWQEINPGAAVPQELVDARENTLKQSEALSTAVSKIDELLGDDNVLSNLRSDKVANQKFLETTHDISIADIDALNEYGRFQYSCGSYSNAAHLLDQFRILSTDNDKVSSATWGKLVCDILTGEWEDVWEEINKVKDSIETRLFNNPLAQLEHRTWLIHWILFPLFNAAASRDRILDLLFSPAFINTIQTNCAWILRYLAAAVVTQSPRTQNLGQSQRQLKDLIRIIKQEGYEYSDPITDLIRALYVDFDFEAAQTLLASMDNVFREDFFLNNHTDSFVEAARQLISESYCKIHHRIDIKDLSQRLGLEAEEGEKWIVNLIRETRMDGKLDYQKGTVLMNHPSSSVYQQVIERTKGSYFRTSVLSAAVAK